MKSAIPALFALMAFISAITPASAVSDEELIKGFNIAVFGTEYVASGTEYVASRTENGLVRKFENPVRFRIHARSKNDRWKRVAKFIHQLDREVDGLEVVIAHPSQKANFNIYIVDRADYKKIVREKVFRNSRRRVPGKCLVLSTHSTNGILYSNAVIVSDDSERLFNRCMIEEILQGLGPLNDSPALTKSVFNDSSRHQTFTTFDKMLMNILYHPRIKAGQSREEVAAIINSVIRDVRSKPQFSSD